MIREAGPPGKGGLEEVLQVGLRAAGGRGGDGGGGEGGLGGGDGGGDGGGEGGLHEWATFPCKCSKYAAPFASISASYAHSWPGQYDCTQQSCRHTTAP